jgi:hypothetical protein
MLNNLAALQALLPEKARARCNGLASPKKTGRAESLGVAQKTGRAVMIWRGPKNRAPHGRPEFTASLRA